MSAHALRRFALKSSAVSLHDIRKTCAILLDFAIWCGVLSKTAHSKTALCLLAPKPASHWRVAEDTDYDPFEFEWPVEEADFVILFVPPP